MCFILLHLKNIHIYFYIVDNNCSSCYLSPSLTCGCPSQISGVTQGLTRGVHIHDEIEGKFRCLALLCQIWDNFPGEIGQGSGQVGGGVMMYFCAFLPLFDSLAVKLNSFQQF